MSAANYSEEAENAIISSMFASKDAIIEVSALLSEKDFFRPQNGLLFSTMVSMMEQDIPVDLVTISARLDADGNMQKVGGLGYVAQIANSIGSAYNIQHYAAIVKDKAIRRGLEAFAAHLTMRCSEGVDKADDILDEAERLVMGLSNRQSGDGLEHISAILESNLAAIENGAGAKGIPTGFVDLDRILGGLHKSDLLILAARPAMGKTSLALNIAQNVAADGNVVAVFSLEMSKAQLVNRMVSSIGEISQSIMKNANLTLEDWSKLATASGKVAELPLFIDDTPAITVREIRARSRRMKSERGLGLIVIDYLQLIGSNGKQESRQQEVSQISRQLKALARELDVPVLALSQLSRAVESANDKRPSMSHLRESGSIEQDADIIMFIYREEYYKPETDKVNIAEVIIAKHRNGATGAIDLSFRKEFTKFGNLYKGV